jgi:hypothetical protein
MPSRCCAGYRTSEGADCGRRRKATVVGHSAPPQWRIDIAEGMLALARRLHPQLEFRHGDAEALPLEDA